MASELEVLALTRAGRYAEAKVVLRRLLTAHPDDFERAYDLWRIERWTGRTQPSQPVLAAAAAYRRMLVGASNNYTGFDPAAAARNSALPWLPWRPEVHQGLPPVDLQNAGDSVITPPFPCTCMESLLMTADISQE